MAEDHVLVLAPKSFASKLSKREGKVGVLNTDVSFDVDAGVVTGVGEGESRQGTIRRLVNHVETWKTYDETNFAKSADVTHFIDFGEASQENTDVLRQNELLRYTALSSEAPTVAANSAAEEAVIHTLTHGMAKCTTTVAFHEEFEDA
uniref:Uncharacterized protein n=1 Tax=Micromonas pusilla TaxID=38833 RepID=A0A7S0GQ80_MICPS|mmetsp:Transcript_11265/g.48074  ORF Transcript_11265/g.48074 Transcript_11265/m.48074 type:complete len:148 (+) Transcript_11265:140-583(+)|eukprot:CAMPEP_0203002272 /NCGR_PEP_ID=MMETSP1401-20130829/1129_1 /ASSEMBLY_ACC=CAM_ASM_000894 /TAXON_ID=38833 /ORGANISM="Micromonas pusilla, Strain CCAC1681" /LENGTH=147 /DNA_ID=CAMNT_0049743799 /DNA_START=104 /DNA_END=547 /DNA_ORIENTATION=+